MMMKIKVNLKKYIIEGLSGMAMGLFATLITGLIIKQIGSIFDLAILVNLGTIATVLTGAGIGVAVSYKFKVAPLIMYSTIVSSMIGAYGKSILTATAFSASGVVLQGPGEPLSAFIATISAIYFGSLVSQKTKIDIIITPLVTIISGGVVGLLIGPYISEFMMGLGSLIVFATEQEPFIMGILVSVIMGMILTLPISSAALAIILGLSGLAAGAATVGCTCQMIGFAVYTYPENKGNGLIAQGLGTSMLQVANIIKKPLIWLPPIIASAILGPVSTMIFQLENNASGAGMGSSGLVGQLMMWQTMQATSNQMVLLVEIISLHFILPAIITILIGKLFRLKGWIKAEDLKLDLK